MKKLNYPKQIKHHTINRIQADKEYNQPKKIKFIINEHPKIKGILKKKKHHNPRHTNQHRKKKTTLIVNPYGGNPPYGGTNPFRTTIPETKKKTR